MTLTSQAISFIVPKIDRVEGCYRVWDKNGQLRATFYKEDCFWVVDFGYSPLQEFQSKSQARACAIAGNHVPILKR